MISTESALFSCSVENATEIRRCKGRSFKGLDFGLVKTGEFAIGSARVSILRRVGRAVADHGAPAHCRILCEP
jgi:hypothetical protein